jgi:hypothetical protein
MSKLRWPRFHTHYQDSHIEIPGHIIRRNTTKFSKQKKFGMKDYEKLLSNYAKDFEVMPYIDYVRIDDTGDRKILIIRHDIDHDFQTARKMAEWENKEGIRATYCVLHSAWYYGRLEGKSIKHTKTLLDLTEHLHNLGHEINFHNNLVVTGLRYGIDPVRLLNQELEYFSSIGIPIKGSTTHGDELCRDYNFRNYELFIELCGRYGGPRTILYNDEGGQKTLTLCRVSMLDFGLEYESEELYWDVYYTDSGGKLRRRENRNGFRWFGRKEKRKRGRLVGILAHPIWWHFD